MYRISRIGRISRMHGGVGCTVRFMQADMGNGTGIAYSVA